MPELNRLDLMFFSRGRGRGHAIPDLAITRALRTIHPNLRSVFASYGTGAATLASAGETVHDLNLPDMCPFLDVLTHSATELRRNLPTVVVCHEDPAVLCAAKIFDVPSIYLSHWLPAANDPYIQAFAYANEVLILEHERTRPEPAQVRGKAQYLGPVLREFTYRPSDRATARSSLGLTSDEAVVGVFPGSWTEKAAGSAELVLAAFSQLERPAKRLIWLAGSDFDYISERCSGRSDVIVVRETATPDFLMVAADVAITKATYNISKEVEALGVRSVSLRTLAECLGNAIDRGLAEPNTADLNGTGAARAALAIAQHLDRLGCSLGGF